MARKLEILFLSSLLKGEEEYDAERKKRENGKHKLRVVLIPTRC